MGIADLVVTERRGVRSAESRIERQPVICLVASRGGHLQQLLRLRPVFGKYRHFLLSTTEKSDRAIDHDIERLFTVADINEGRAIKNPLRFAVSIVQTFTVLARERPSVILSTGAGVAVPAFLVARVLGIPSIYLESYARIRELSLAGRVCYRLATCFLVQHEQLIEGRPRARYAGSIYEHI
jgi:UDP-N-acetylglucosamine:LPS N-acetylglucosamine transferase